MQQTNSHHVDSYVIEHVLESVLPVETSVFICCMYIYVGPAVVCEHGAIYYFAFQEAANAGKRLFSPAGEQVRPMMEKVRGALFSMLLTGTVGRSTFPKDARWLDLFAGTVRHPHTCVRLRHILSLTSQGVHTTFLGSWMGAVCQSSS